MDQVLYFRISLISYNYFVDGKFTEKLNKEVRDYLKNIGIIAEILPTPMKGAGFDLTLLIKLLSLAGKIYHFLTNIVSRIAARTFSGTKPQLEVYVNHVVDDAIYTHNGLPGDIQTELLQHAWTVKMWIESHYQNYNVQLTSNVYYKKYDYIFTSALTKDKATKRDIGLLIHLVRTANLKSNLHEYVNYSDKKLVRHSRTIFNVDHRAIRTRRLYYLKIDKMINGTLRARGLKRVGNAKWPDEFKVVPRLAKSNI